MSENAQYGLGRNAMCRMFQAVITKDRRTALVRVFFTAVRVSDNMEYDFSYCGNPEELHNPSHKLLVFELQTHAKSTGVFKLQL